MKKVISLASALLFSLGFVSNIYCETADDTPVIVMGVKTIIYKDDKMKVLTCPPPTNNPCVTCPGGESGGSQKSVGQFIHNPENPNIGEGHTDVDVETGVDESGNKKFTLTINPSDQVITNYAEWLKYFNYSNPLSK